MLQYMYSNETAVNLLKLFILTNILVNFINGLEYEVQSWIKKQGEKNFLFSAVSRLVLGPIQPHIQCVPQALSPSIKQLGHAADYTPPSSTKVKLCGDIHPNEVVLMKFGTETLLGYDQSCYGLTEDCLVMFLHKTPGSATKQNWTLLLPLVCDLSSHSLSEISLHPDMH
jgi:hypothetical protein